MKLLLVNPNTNAATTAAMLAIAQEHAPPGGEIIGVTAPFGVPLITEPDALEEAGRAVETLFETPFPAEIDGVILAAFGDPALEPLRRRLACPVTGIAEAGMLEAATPQRAFAVVTTTPALVGSIAGLAERYGLGRHYLGTELVAGDPLAVMKDPVALPRALEAACLSAIRRWKPEALIIGGGPLAVAARAIASLIPVPLIEPVPAAVRLAIRRATQASEAKWRSA